VFKHCNWGKLVIELVYCAVCIHIYSGVLRLHKGVEDLLVGFKKGS